MLGTDGSSWLDRLHMQLARSLQAEGWSQQNISGIIGMTQSTISRQKSRPLPELKGTADEIVVDGWASEMTEMLARIGPGARLRHQRFVIEFVFEGGQNMRFDKILTGTDLDRGQARAGLLRRLEWITQRFIIPKLEPYRPAVEINIAACTEGAEDRDDVASFPGRLSIIDDQLKYLVSPTFGASDHLTSVLLQAREQGSEARAIINLALSDSAKKAMDSACEGIGFTPADAPKGLVADSAKEADVLLDEGAFGWEPAMYVLASNPIELVDKTHLLIEALEG